MLGLRAKHEEQVTRFAQLHCLQYNPAAFGHSLPHRKTGGCLPIGSADATL